MLAIVVVACASPQRTAPSAPAGQSRFPVREWSKLPPEGKLAVITGAIELARRDGTEIRLPAAYYVAQIDALSRAYESAGSEEGLDSSVGATFRTIAIMEGDWDNDEGKVEQARRILGPEDFEQFKARYPDKYRRLVEIDEATGAAARSKPAGRESDGTP
ncbi:MAG: hypothetical protein AB1689_17685 [Thermodesulfobacteriota bacterium]